MNILVVGGAGFIGSITSKYLADKGHDVVVYDSLIKGYQDAVDKKCVFVNGCLSNKKLLEETFRKNKIDSVMHFAGFIEAGESMKNPYYFFNNNFVNGLNLLEAMRSSNVKKIIYSSSAAVYTPKNTPLKEDDLKIPENVYGQTKLNFESALKWYHEIYGIKSISLRYFNAYGNFEELGERHNPETHLIPLIFQAALGKMQNIKVFGTDYPTYDGSCIRDYIHVKDLAEAHLLALEKINNDNVSAMAYNVGTGKGYSVKEVVDTIKAVTGNNFQVIFTDKRAGDSPILLADPEKIKKELGWHPKVDFYTGIKENFSYFKKRFEK